MEAQYYTPTIDEFHSGFEYQIKNADWDNKIVVLDTMLDAIEYHLKSGVIRVKSLDRQDIEECGWKMEHSYWDRTDLSRTKIIRLTPFFSEELHFEFEINEHDLFILKLNNSNVEIIHAKKESLDLMTKTEVLKQEAMIFSTIFEGTIRNKSELLKIMQQCGISA